MDLMDNWSQHKHAFNQFLLVFKYTTFTFFDFCFTFNEPKIVMLFAKGCLQKKNSIWRDIVPIRGGGGKENL